LLKYDAIIKGQDAKNESLQNDFDEIRSIAIDKERHERDLHEFDKNLRLLI
jgi:hypothetical protein